MILIPQLSPVWAAGFTPACHFLYLLSLHGDSRGTSNQPRKNVSPAMEHMALKPQRRNTFYTEQICDTSRLAASPADTIRLHLSLLGTTLMQVIQPRRRCCQSLPAVVWAQNNRAVVVCSESVKRGFPPGGGLESDHAFRDLHLAVLISMLCWKCISL